ncbi:MAG: hypothetical protein WBA05_14085 [Gordonia sp. (in: high G+C Gram-positive bacteria)]|uniref:hypothetical protein n=1 Tax=Gordonia sp. (in: high G+C Gram-positive bacteria) TaxID=84139 RepID=UPI003C709A96
MDRILRFAHADEDLFLDLVDLLLLLKAGSARGLAATRLDTVLAASASVWKVSESRDSLEHRTSAELGETVELATSPNDEASNQLRQAWSNAYGRNGSPSYAWVDAIKAVEALLIPIVIPNDAKSKQTLGRVLGVLRANDGNKWRGSLPGTDKDHPVAPVVGALELLWPNPDRHGEPNPRPPSEEEARSVVAVAAALIQAHRETPLVYKVP